MAYTPPSFGTNPFNPPGTPTTPTGGVTPPIFGTGGPSGSAMQQLMQFFTSPGGAGALNFAGGLLKGYGTSQTSNQDRAQNAAEFTANKIQQQQEDQTAAAENALASNPLGANQKYAQKQALLAAILPNVRNFSVTPGDPAVAKAMGTMSGGILDLIPQGGFSASTLGAYAPQATASAIAQHDMATGGVDPQAPTTDLSALGFSPDVANPLQSRVSGYFGQQNTQRQQAMDAINRALQNDIAGQKSGGGFWHDLGKIAAIAAPIAAAPFTGGATLGLIGAGAGAANAALSGGGLGSILMGAGLGAIPGLSTPKGLASGTAAPAIGTGLKQAFTNPLNIARIGLGALG